MQCIYHIYRKCLAKRHIKLKKAPNPSKTYAWRALSRFMKQIGNCSNEVVVQLLDEIIDFVIVNNKGRGILAALHNKELIIHCCNRLKEKERHCSMVIQKLERSVAFVAAQYQVGEHLELRHGLRTWPNIVAWYKSNHIFDIFLALSQKANCVMRELPQEDRIELPSMMEINSIRISWLSHPRRRNQCKSILGEDLVRLNLGELHVD